MYSLVGNDLSNSYLDYFSVTEDILCQDQHRKLKSMITLQRKIRLLVTEGLFAEGHR